MCFIYIVQRLGGLLLSIKGKNILLCVTGGIAAYKACDLTSKLTKAGADVHVIMTSSAKAFVSPVTFQALSRNPVHDDVFTEKVPHQIAHIDLADKADLVLVAPATANVIGKLANGLADEMVLATVLATQAPVWIAPAMNVNMYQHPAVKRNMTILNDMGMAIIESGEGNLACGWTGKGRLAEPEEMVARITSYFGTENSGLQGKNVLITAGSTREALDPVRFFSNRSTGRMGYALAQAAREAGADVTLISGPTSLAAPEDVDIVRVTTALEMYDAVLNRFDTADVVIKSAAVADYRPDEVSEHKIKKHDDDMVVRMVRNPDIAAALGQKKTNQFLVGFAAETQDIETAARQKMANKQLDMVVANNVAADDAGFATDTNRVIIFTQDGQKRAMELMSKTDVAAQIIGDISKLFTGDGSSS